MVKTLLLLLVLALSSWGQVDTSFGEPMVSTELEVLNAASSGLSSHHGLFVAELAQLRHAPDFTLDDVLTSKGRFGVVGGFWGPGTLAVVIPPPDPIPEPSQGWLFLGGLMVSAYPLSRKLRNMKGGAIES